MFLAYLCPSHAAVFCIVSFSAFRSFLIHRKREQDGEACMKYLFLPGRKHSLLTQATHTNSPNTAKYITPRLLQLHVFPRGPSATPRLHNQPRQTSPTLKIFKKVRGKKTWGKHLGRQRVAKVEYTLTPSLTLAEVGVAKCAACVANVPFVTSGGPAEAATSCAPR